MRKVGFFMIGAVAGGLLASVVALLLAPASGERLRGQITDYTQQVVSDVRNAASQRRIELESQLTALRTPQTN